MCVEMSNMDEYEFGYGVNASETKRKQIDLYIRYCGFIGITSISYMTPFFSLLFVTSL